MSKKIFIICLTILTITILLTGCGKEPLSSNDNNNEIKIARRLDATNLDPVATNDNTSIWTLSLITEGLVKTSDDGKKLEPNLASSWDISDDKTTYTFHLIPDLKFSDGSPVKGSDWIFSFNRAKNAEENFWKFAVENIDSITAPDDQTLVVKLKKANSSTLSFLSMFNLSVQSEANYQTNKDLYASNGPMGTGPYYLKEHVKDEYISLEKNPYYRQKDTIKTDKLKFITVPDDNSRIMQLQGGDVDIITDVPYENMENLKQDNNIITQGINSTSNKYLILNTTDPILSNPKVRQALAMATDKKQLVDMVLKGYGEEAVSYMPKNGLYWDDSITPLKYDPEAAKSLLTEAGYPDGFTLQFLIRSGNSSYEQIATIIKDQWEKIGVKVNLVPMETAALLEQEKSMKHQVLIGQWTDDLLDPSQLSNYFWNFNVSKGFYTGYNNPAATALFTQSLTELDDQKRAQLYDQLQNIFYNEVPAINLYHEQFTVAMNKNIKGFVQTPLGAYQFNNLVKQ